jgi:SAM-dependent methyltransferase
VFEEFDLGAGNLLQRCAACGTVSAREYADPADIYVDGYLFGQVGNFGVDVRDPLFQRYLMRVAHRRMEIIERATGKATGSLLDVGCGSGEVLLAARERGWRTSGVEPERTGAEMAQGRGLDVRIAPLEESGLPERSYDVVSAFHVLEHIAHGLPFLEQLMRWARPGGHLVIEVPNWRSVQRRRLREHWSGLRPLEHIVHHTPQTLDRLMRSAGLEPVLVRSPSYLGPPQNLQHALNDLVRHGRYRRLLERLSSRQAPDGESALYPTKAGWTVLRATEAIYDRAGVGAVVLAVGAVP